MLMQWFYIVISEMYFFDGFFVFVLALDMYSVYDDR